MPRSLSKGATPCRVEDHPTGPFTSSTASTACPQPDRLVAIARNRWSSSIGQVVAITRSAQSTTGRAGSLRLDQGRVSELGPWPALLHHYAGDDLSGSVALGFELRRGPAAMIASGYSCRRCVWQGVTVCSAAARFIAEATVAAASLDRLRHHSQVITMRDDSYRVGCETSSGRLLKTTEPRGAGTITAMITQGGRFSSRQADRFRLWLDTWFSDGHQQGDRNCFLR
jgi:hypothetical protein